MNSCYSFRHDLVKPRLHVQTGLSNHSTFVQTNLKQWLDGQTASVALLCSDCLSATYQFAGFQQALAQTHGKRFEEAGGRGQVAKWAEHVSLWSGLTNQFARVTRALGMTL